MTSERYRSGVELREQARNEIADIANDKVPVVENPIFDPISVLHAFKGELWMERGRLRKQIFELQRDHETLMMNHAKATREISALQKKIAEVPPVEESEIVQRLLQWVRNLEKKNEELLNQLTRIKNIVMERNTTPS